MTYSICAKLVRDFHVILTDKGIRDPTLRNGGQLTKRPKCVRKSLTQTPLLLLVKVIIRPTSSHTRSSAPMKPI